MKMNRASFHGLLHSRRFVVFAIIVGLLGTGTGVVFSRSGSSPVVAPVLTTVANRGSVMITAASSGPVSAWSPLAGASPTAPTGFPIYPSTTGQVQKIFITPGQVVHAGQVIATLSDPSVASSVLQAQIGVRSAQIAAAAAASNKTQAQLDLTNAKLAYQTLRKGSPPHSQAALAAAQLAITVAELKLNALGASPSLPSQIAAARLSVTLAQQQLAALSAQQAIDMSSAQLAVQKAQNDLNAAYASSSAQIAAAQSNVAQAQQQLAALVNPSVPDMTAAQLVVQKAQADLNAAYASSSSQIAAAQLNVTQAKQQVATVANRVAVDQTSAQLAVQKAQNNLDALLAPPSASQIAAAKLDLANAKIAYSNLVLASAPPSRTSVAAARLAVTVASQKLASLMLPPTQGSADLNYLQVAVAKNALALALLQRGGLTVRSSVGGTVTGVLVAPGSQVGPTSAIATVADLRHLLVTAQMSEFDVAHIRRGQHAIVDVAAIGLRGLPATVVSVAPVGVNNSGVIQFPVTVSLRRAPSNLRPGMLASIQVITAERHGVIRVPLNAMSVISGGNNGGSPYVTVLNQAGHRRIQLVKVGLVGGNYAEITKGLKGGERLVLPQSTPTVSASTSTGKAPPGIGVPAAGSGQGGNH